MRLEVPVERTHIERKLGLAHKAVWIGYAARPSDPIQPHVVPAGCVPVLVSDYVDPTADHAL